MEKNSFRFLLLSIFLYRFVQNFFLLSIGGQKKRRKKNAKEQKKIKKRILSSGIHSQKFFSRLINWYSYKKILLKWKIIFKNEMKKNSITDTMNVVNWNELFFLAKEKTEDRWKKW